MLICKLDTLVLLPRRWNIPTLRDDAQTIAIDADKYTAVPNYPLNEKGIYVQDQQLRNADFILTNVRAKNGIAHVIPRVLLPLFDTIVQIAASFPNQFSILVEAVTRVGLIDELSGPGPFTVFAPTNEAFIYLADSLGITVEDLYDIPSLKDIILYHVLGSFTLTSDLQDGEELVTLKSDGQTLTVSYNSTLQDPTAIQILDKQLFNPAVISLANVRAKNGVAHVVDHILIPEFDSVYDIAASFPSLFSTLVAAVDSEGLKPALQDPTATYTVFAPRNDAFNTLMFALLRITVDELLAIPNLDQIILYYVVTGQELTIADIVSLNGKTITMSRTDGQTILVNAI